LINIHIHMRCLISDLVFATSSRHNPPQRTRLEFFVAKSSTDWQELLTLSTQRQRVAGDEKELAAAISRGADFRVGTTFRHNQHIDTKSTSDELIRETMQFQVTYLVDGCWSAGVCTMRQPVALPNEFGPRPSMSFFLYNQDARQAIARPYLDGPPAQGQRGPSPLDDFSDMPRYHQFDNWDAQTNAPNHNFVYDFDIFHFYARDNWTEVLSHSKEGKVVGGSVEELSRAIDQGWDVKVAVGGLCDDLVPAGAPALPHEVIVQTTACYYYTDQKLFIAATHPLVRIAPAIPLCYRSGGWDFGWLVVRSDGHVARMLYNPYTLTPQRSQVKCSLRWFVR
jgi:hypothetical protein